MTELLSGLQSEVDAPSDAELISRVREGDTAAYGELFNRHVEAARRLGRQLVRGTDVDDLVSEAFAKLLHVLQGGGGPDVAFRAYLLTAVRRLHVDRVRATARTQPAEDMSLYDPGVPFRDTAVASFESGAAARAFSSLPERWQLVLWHLEVEGQKPAEIAPLLGMTPNSVSALAYRAREGLRQAFLTMHLADSATEECRWVNENLGAYVRKGLSRRDTAKVREHLDECRRCTAMYLELIEVNSNLSGIIAPLMLGAAAAGYLSSNGSAGLAGVAAALGRVRDSAAANTGVTVAGAIAAGVAAVTTAALVLGGGSRELVIEADEPAGGTLPPGAGAPVTPGDRRETQDPVRANGNATGSEEAVLAAPLGPVSTGTGDAVGAGDDATVPDTAGDAPVVDGPAPVDSEPDPLVDPVEGAGDGPGSGPGSGPGEGPGSGPGSGPGDAPGEAPGPDAPPADTPGTSPGGTGGDGRTAPAEFAISGVSLSSAGSGDDRHLYTVSISFVGVAGGDSIALSLTGPQAEVCLPSCTDRTRTTSLTTTVPAGATEHTVTFTAWVPGQSRTDVTATRNGGATATYSLA